MAGDTFLDTVSGYDTQRRGTQTSSGVGQAGDIVALGDDGYIDPSLLPAGSGPDVKIVQASEALAAGDWVNIHNVAGAFRCRKADASGGVAKKVDGYVKASVLSGAMATVYYDGLNTGLTSILPGDYWITSTPGVASQTPPTTSAYIVQIVGAGASTTEIEASIQEPRILA